jgi:Toxin co-regulated pilus biosynthesis protein Q
MKFFLTSVWLAATMLISTQPVSAGQLKLSTDKMEAGALELRPPVGTPIPIPVIAAPVPLFELVKDKRVDDQLRAYAKRSGWDHFIWQAPEYVLDQNMLIPGEFEASIAFFLKGANEAGSHLRAVFYRGNKTIRITEF